MRDRTDAEFHVVILISRTLYLSNVLCYIIQAVFEVHMVILKFLFQEPFTYQVYYVTSY